jgi:putative DNA primase/helicase
MIAPALKALTAYRQFIVYKLAPSKTRPGKSDKLPINPNTGTVANAQDPTHWLDFDGASRRAREFGAGFAVGFVLTPETKLFCLDMDNCLLPDRSNWTPTALALCAMFPGAAVERSVSGTGLHIWGTYSGDAPPHACKNIELGLELYTENRFIALGDAESAVGDAATDCTSVLESIIPFYFPPDAATTGEQGWTDGPVEEWRGPADDDELIQRALRSKQSAASAFGNRASFADLWNNNGAALMHAYPAEGRMYDASSADAALAQHLAFYTGKDCERIERLMNKSALVRDKWTNHKDYLRRTILGAVVRQDEVFVEKALPPSLTVPSGTPDELTLKGVEASLLQLGTQDAIAQIFALKMKDKMLFNHTRGKWLEWDGARWKVEVTQKAFDFARNLARAVNLDGKSSLGSAAFCIGVETHAKSDRALAAEGTEFDLDNYLLNTPGGTFDLRMNTLRPHDPNDRMTLCTRATPTTEGGAVFDKFLYEITQGDKDLAEFLQVSLGACLSGAVESHWMLFWIGEGRNGKNTLGDLVMDVMGDYARKVGADVLMAKLHEGHPTEIANLQGIRLAVSSEINEGDHWSEKRINELTGDSTLSARFMRCDSFEFKRTHKHLIFGNHRPQLRTVTSALRSRIKIVPFKASFVGREDGDLPRRLRENLGYVLAWLIEGHKKWLDAGKRLPQCQAVEDESAEYFAAQSTVEMWLSERVEILASDERNVLSLPQAGVLYRDYANWKKERGENPVSMTRWSDSLRGFQKVKSRGVRYRGLMLIPQFGDVPFPLSTNAPKLAVV